MPGLAADNHVADMALDQWPIHAGPEIDDGKAFMGGENHQIAIRGVGILMEVKAGAARLVGQTNNTMTG